MDEVDIPDVVFVVCRIIIVVFPFLFLLSLFRLNRVSIRGGLTDFLTRFTSRRAFQWLGYSSFILLFRECV